MKTIFIILSVLFIIFIYLFIEKPRHNTGTITRADTIRISDTLIIYDTLRITEFKPVKEYVVRYDTITVHDTIKSLIPIEVRTYKTEQYEAKIEGYKPSLLSLDFYGKSLIIRDTVKINTTVANGKSLKSSRPRIAVTIGSGLGYSDSRIAPYIGVSIGYVVWCK